MPNELYLIRSSFENMIQEIVVFILFALALIYLVRPSLFRGKKASKGCASGCAACNTIDFEKIAAQIQKDSRVQ